MSKIKAAKISLLSLVAAFALSPLVAPAILAQEHGAIDTPQAKPRVDQLGQMEDVPTADRIFLALGLFLQVVTCVAVAIAFAGHKSMPPKKKPQ